MTMYQILQQESYQWDQKLQLRGCDAEHPEPQFF